MEGWPPQPRLARISIDPRIGKLLIMRRRSSVTSIRPIFESQAGADGNRTHQAPEYDASPVLKTGTVTRAAFTPELFFGAIRQSHAYSNAIKTLNFTGFQRWRSIEQQDRTLRLNSISVTHRKSMN